METVQIEEARKTLGELVDRARLAGEPTMILRNRKPGAVLVPVGWYEEASAILRGPEKPYHGGPQKPYHSPGAL